MSYTPEAAREEIAGWQWNPNGGTINVTSGKDPRPLLEYLLGSPKKARKSRKPKAGD